MSKGGMQQLGGYLHKTRAAIYLLLTKTGRTKLYGSRTVKTGRLDGVLAKGAEGGWALNYGTTTGGSVGERK